MLKMSDADFDVLLAPPDAPDGEKIVIGLDFGTTFSG
jgi:hypothetical protein